MSEPTLTVSQPATIEGLNSQGEGVRVEFQKLGDRFGHTIFKIHEGKAIPLLKSIEGTPDEVAPSSPPFAELHQQGETLFLSGATTLGHWSMSVELVEGRLLFEVACRLKKRADWLGSSYHIGDANYVVEPGETAQTAIRQDTHLVTPASPISDPFPTTIQWRYSITNRK